MTARSSTDPDVLTSGRLLARNTLWNLLGQGMPIVVAIFTIPLLIKGMGIDRFGVLTIVWVFIGYFGLFDLGMGRALIVLVATNLGNRRGDENPTLVWTALCLMLGLGLVAGLILSLLSPWLAYAVIEIPSELQSETLKTFYLISIAIPIVVTTAGLKGILAAHQRFDLINGIHSATATLGYLGPLFILLFSNRLNYVVGLLVVIRLIAWVLYIVLSIRIMPDLGREFRFSREVYMPLIRTGGWLTITNLIGSLMTYSGRLIIGAVISVTAVAYYATPYEVVGRLRIFPVAMMGVIFPAFATSSVSDTNKLARLYNRSMKYIFMIMFPIALIVVTLSNDILNIWLGTEFARESTQVMRLLIVGILINSLAKPPYTFLQGIGRADLTAKLHLGALPIYLIVMWWLIGKYGITGAAVSFVAWMAVAFILLLYMARRHLSGEAFGISTIAVIGLTATLVLFAATIFSGLAPRIVFLCTMLFIFTFLVWFKLLESEERALIKKSVSRLFKFS